MATNDKEEIMRELRYENAVNSQKKSLNEARFLTALFFVLAGILFVVAVFNPASVMLTLAFATLLAFGGIMGIVDINEFKMELRVMALEYKAGKDRWE